jgi:mono/diheme cytochrome c family protein
MIARSRLPLLLLLLPASGLLVAAAPPPAPSKAPGSAAPGAAGRAAPAAPDTFKQQVLPLIQKYCVGCHGGANPSAGLSLTRFPDTASVLKARDVWDKVSHNVRMQHMPPPGLPQPTAAERQQMATWIDSTLSTSDCKILDPGRVTMRRLNREEYNNTIRDLVGLDLHPADDFPSDDVGYGFDNIGDVLTISPLLMEKYMSAAEKIAQAAIIPPEARAKEGAKAPLPPSQRRIIFCQPASPAQRDACARRIIAAFAPRTYRRPVTAGEVDRLLRCAHLAWQDGGSFERGIQLALEAALVSPNFLFRVETDRTPHDPKATHLVGQYEMASRLSYFLWSSMPDEELFSLAAKGRLQDPAVLAAQVKRMLKDPKAQALADNFAGQWLELRKLGIVAPNPRQFPMFNKALREAMRTETEMFFEAVVKEDRSVLDFLDGRFTFVNGPLAQLYGIPGITGDQFRRVALTGNERRGVLTQASILTVTSNPTRTSPVKRGKWVLEQFLGTPPPPPPPGTPPLPERRRGRLLGTLRQQMEQHRKNPMCAACHRSMDPIGFGLENFDAIGRWRTQDGTYPIDASGVLPDGQKFNGPVELIGILKSKQTQFVRCLSEKMLTYALGRGLEPNDHCNIDQIVRNVARHNNHFSALVTEVVQSNPFRKRRGDAEAQSTETAKAGA